jgi:hypothetical protein
MKEHNNNNRPRNIKLGKKQIQPPTILKLPLCQPANISRQELKRRLLAKFNNNKKTSTK